ncbi:MAG: RnfABCDGE type electron transport complex subunit D, partial [Eubacteriales bacterium]|nr:RnfABCDGE type electron transport complex subunit D [Eubacteriales bacterium]
DYVTSPIMPQAKLIYGIGCGAVTMIIRLMCSYPEGVSFAILFMNVMTPLIEKNVVSKYYASLYGGGAKKDEK